jgi:hypothetical protein
MCGLVGHCACSVFCLFAADSFGSGWWARWAVFLFAVVTAMPNVTRCVQSDTCQTHAAERQSETGLQQAQRHNKSIQKASSHRLFEQASTSNAMTPRKFFNCHKVKVKETFEIFSNQTRRAFLLFSIKSKRWRRLLRRVNAKSYKKLEKTRQENERITLI